jgi:hypothetical protein
MSFSVSPSVTVREVDLTSSIPAITTPPAAIAGVFRWGPVNERVLISSEVELANVFGAPTDFNAETFFTAADFLSYSNALYVVRVEDGAQRAVGTNSLADTVFEGKYPGAIGNDFEVTYVVTDTTGDASSFSEEIFQGDTFAIDFGSNTLEVVTKDELVDLDVKVGDILSIGTDETGFQSLEVVALSNVSQEAVSNNEIEYTHEITFRQAFRQAVTPTKVFRNWRNTGAVNEAPAAGNLHIVVFDRIGNISGTAGAIIEKFENLSLTPGTKGPEGTNLFYRDVLEQRSNFIRAGADDISASTSAREYVQLTGGSDGQNESLIPFGKVALGYDLFKEANDVDVSFILQGSARGADVTKSSLANYLISNITESRRDCVVFVSPNRASVVDVATEQSKLTNVLAFRADVQNSSYAFIDSGYKYRYDKYNDVFRWVPLNGDMAGLASLVEPWESPAGFRKGRVRNVIKLAFNPNKAQRDQLYGRDINPVISQVGQGTILFGDKTALGTATGSAFTRINVRRLFITVEKAIATISAQFLFEFNDEFTQNQFRQIVDPFLRDIQGRRGIIDFRVISDATINTPQVVDSNTFRANIFIKPARSINQIELTFVATRTGVEFEEIVGQQF